MSEPDFLNEVDAEVTALSRWFNERLAQLEAGEDREAFEGWRRELAAIRALIDEPNRVRVALIGTTGAGKSTFLNAVLRQEVLPVGVMHPCTAFVTAVSYRPGHAYEVTVRYATREEWRRDVEAFAAMLEPGEADVGGGERLETSRMLEVARKRLQGVYGDRLSDDAAATEVLAVELPEAAQEVFRGPSVQGQEFAEPKEMLNYVRGLIRGESPLWPLVQEVSIRGPYEALRGGVELVDLPGLNDPNEARVEVTREYLRTSPFVWLIFPMVRGLTADIQRILSEEKILRTLVLNGTYSGLALVGTKADDIDMDSAEQLGLPDDCEFSELVAAYRDQTVLEARGQLEEIVRGLPDSAEVRETHDRMIEMARSVRVHTTSASAYNKLAGVGRLRRDYGLEDVSETGIPGIHEHLAEISRAAGADFSAYAARDRAEQLKHEIELYFRAKGEASSPKVEEARDRFRRQSEDFNRDVVGYREQAARQLELHRQRFLERLDPIFAQSAAGVVRTAEGWRGLYWSTLRAIVQRDGVFRSPSTGKSHDLNADLSEPFLAALPVFWEKYFTDDLGSVTREFVVRLEEAGKHLCDKIALTAELLSGSVDNPMGDQLTWFRQKVELTASDAERHVTQVVRERRSELATSLPVVAQQRMRPAYVRSRGERGRGMKARMLDHLETTASEASRPMYDTMQSMILEGLGDLEVQITGLYERLSATAAEQARIVVNNANVGIDEASRDPVVEDALRAMPGSVR
ncbi:MAG: dynamin family protein [Dehalococcoidia bacterium]